MTPDLLHGRVHHVARPAGDDPPRRTGGGPGRIEEPAAVEAQVGQVPADRAHRHGHAVGGELQGDAAGRPFAVVAQPLDPDHHLGRGGGGLPTRSARAIQQAGLAEAAVAVDLHRGALLGDAISAATWAIGRVQQCWTRRWRPVDGQRGLRWSTDGPSSSADVLVAVLILPPKDPSLVSGPASRHQRHDPQHLDVRWNRDGGRGGCRRLRTNDGRGTVGSGFSMRLLVEELSGRTSQDVQLQPQGSDRSVGDRQGEDRPAALVSAKPATA